MARRTRSSSKWLLGALSLLLLTSCAWPPWNPGPTPTPTPPPVPYIPPAEEQCHLMTPPAMANCYDNPPNGESFPEWDPNWGYVCALPQGGTTRVGLPDQCPVAPPLPQPQCETFVNRGGQVAVRMGSGACDCYIGHEPQPPCEPPTGECIFPQGVPEGDFTGGETSTLLGTQVNAAMERVTGCPKGTNCSTGMGADEFFDAVNSELRSTGLCAGRHKDSPPGASDEIAVATECTGWWEGYHVYNYGGGKVVWSPGAGRPRWKIDPKWCAGTGPPDPPSGECPAPHPDTTRMKFQSSEQGSHLDTTWITVNQPGYCASIGYCCMPGTGTPPNTCDSPGCIPRGGCPVRGDGDPIRATCESELCDQKWECNGEPGPPYRGNPAQTDCRGHYKTWCSANGSTAVLEGDR